MNYLEQRDVVDEMLYMAKEQHYSTVIQDNTHDSKLLFRTFFDFFSPKIVRIRDELLVKREQLGELTMEDFECTSCFSEFATVTDENVLGLIRGSIKACALDPFSASIMRKCYSSFFFCI